MILDYTEEESLRWKAIQDKYAALAEKHTKSGLAYLDRDAIEKLTNDDEIRAKRQAELDALHDEIERKRIAEIADDPQKLLDAIKWQVTQTVETFVSGQIAAEYLNQRTEYSKALAAARKSAEKAAERLQIPSIKKIADSITSKPILEIKEALALVEENIAGLREALKKHREQYKQLNDFISDTLRKSPYVYFEEHTKAAKTQLRPIKTYGLMNSKMASQILQPYGDVFRRKIDGQISFIWEVSEDKDAQGEPIPVSIALSFEGEGTELTKKMTAFDEAVHNALTTCFYYHKQTNPNKPLVITPQEIWRVMTKETNRRKSPSKKWVTRIRASVDKMLFTGLYMDISHEMEARGLKINDERVIRGKIRTYLLKGYYGEFETEKGNIVEAYAILEEPVLYTYLSAKNRVLWISYDLLDVSSTTGYEGNTIVFRDYLLRQIELMKKGMRDSRRILYRTIYNATALPSPEEVERKNFTSENAYKTAIKKNAKRDREKIADILRAWIEKNYIKGFSPVKKGKAFIGIDVAITDADIKELEETGREVIKKE